MADSAQQCASCAFWQRDDDASGACTRHAPNRFFAAERLSGWPTTAADEVCDEWQGTAEGGECSYCVFWQIDDPDINRGDCLRREFANERFSTFEIDACGDFEPVGVD